MTVEYAAGDMATQALRDDLDGRQPVVLDEEEQDQRGTFSKLKRWCIIS